MIPVTNTFCRVNDDPPAITPWSWTRVARLPDPPALADEVTALIDKLTDVERQDTGYSGSTSGAAFLPLGQSETHTALLFQQPNTKSDALKALVKLGAKAVPQLLAHLGDARPTKITLIHQGLFGGMFITQDKEFEPKEERQGFFNQETKYTVMVGDLCYVALGQIVNRDFTAVRYIPTAIVEVTSLPRSKKLREDLTKEWAGLTPEKHQDLLAQDLLDPGKEHRRNGASLRLAYYYPKVLEALALKELARPTYSVFAVSKLVRGPLYSAKTAAERKKLVEDFVAEHGEIVREGIQWALFEDLDSQIADEEGRIHPKLDLRYRARECLMDVFGQPAKVKPEDGPKSRPLSESAQERFIQTLHYDASEKLDHALRDLLAKTADHSMAKGCLDRLVGRGYDTDIEAYLKRGLPQTKEKYYRDQLAAYEAKLGWTRLHAAVDLGLLEYVEAALKQSGSVDAPGRDGRTALHLAAEQGDRDIAARLLQAKAKPNLADKKGRLPVQLAADADFADLVRLLVEKGSDVPDVFTAATVGATDRLTALLKAEPARAKLINRDGFTPLHIAAREGHVEATHVLLAAGLSVNEKKGEDGWTPLHWAVIGGKLATATVLLDRGADVNAADQRGKLTPLHYAAWFGNVELTKLLLERKADRNNKDERERTPLDLARERKHATIIQLLEK